jgi:hypothetical protein
MNFFFCKCLPLLHLLGSRELDVSEVGWRDRWTTFFLRCPDERLEKPLHP